MLFTNLAIKLSEKGLMPDAVIRAGIRQLCKQRLNEIAAADCEVSSEIRERFFASMKIAEIAPLPDTVVVTGLKVFIRWIILRMRRLRSLRSMLICKMVKRY